MQFVVVVDNRRSWFMPFARKLVELLPEFGPAKLLHSMQEIPLGNEVTFLLSCEKMASAEVLTRSKHNIVVHASELPRGKGMSPLTWQILEGKNFVPISLFEAVEAPDAGIIYLRDSVHFQGAELLLEMQATLGEKILTMCLRFVREYPAIISRGQSQVGVESFYRRRKPEDSRLDPNKTIAEQFNLLRVVDNERYPAFFEWEGRKFIIQINSPSRDTPV